MGAFPTSGCWKAMSGKKNAALVRGVFHIEVEFLTYFETERWNIRSIFSFRSFTPALAVSAEAWARLAAA